VPLPEWLKRAGTWRWLPAATATWAIACYCLTYFALLDRTSPYLYMYLLEPLLWGSLALVGLLGWKCLPADRPRISRALFLVTVLLGAAQVSVSVLAGLLFGFGRSPYTHNFPNILGNLLFAATYLLGFEVSRAYLLVWLNRRRPAIALIAVTLFICALEIPFGKYRLLAMGTDIAMILGGTVLPGLAQGLAASYLALTGGPLAAIGYLGTMQAFEWLSPILPKLDWPALALVGTLMPLVAMYTVHSLFAPESESNVTAAKQQEGSSLTSWIAVGIVAVLLVWLNTGILGIQPTLVGSGSMQPVLRVGDVVMVRTVPAQSVAVGDIIRYRKEGVDVIHRVVAIKNEGGLQFVTKGDANNAEDTPVPAEALRGKVVLVVPKIGWVSIWARQLLAGLGGIGR